MGKINIAIKDETEERLRRTIADHMGVKKGNFSKALGRKWYLTDLLVDPYIRIRKTTAAALIHLRQKFVNLNCYIINYKAINSY